MKRKIISLALVVCLIAIAAVGTLAYFTDKDSVKNTFTVGQVDINLDEAVVEKDDSGKYVVTDTRTEDGCTYEDIYPGELIAKDPTVTNVGSYDAYTRVIVKLPTSFVSFMLKYYAGDNYTGTADEVEAVISQMFVGYDADNWDYVTSIDAADLFASPRVDNTLFVFDYNGILAPDEKVTLFTGIQMPAGMTNEDVTDYALSSFTMDITAYATQTKGFAADEATFVAAERDSALDASFGDKTQDSYVKYWVKAAN